VSCIFLRHWILTDEKKLIFFSGAHGHLGPPGVPGILGEPGRIGVVGLEGRRGVDGLIGGVGANGGPGVAGVYVCVCVCIYTILEKKNVISQC
jgi:hypothetical protein